MKKRLMVCLMAAMCIGSSMTALAAPETMPDGVVFDAEYYAQNNPDVVAALGTGQEALYQHYVAYGKGEGRLPYSPDAQISTDTASATQRDDGLPVEGVLAVAGVDYTLPTWSYADTYGDDIDVADGIKNMTLHRYQDKNNMHSEQLAQYTVPGYEWRSISLNIGGELNDFARWWPAYNYKCTAQYSDDWQKVENESGLDMSQFKITQDGIDYTQCKSVVYNWDQLGEVNTELSVWFLVPENYRGNLVLIVRAVKPEGEDLVTDTENAVTYVF